MRKEDSEAPIHPVSTKRTKTAIALTVLAVVVLGWLVLRPYTPAKNTTPWTGEVAKPAANRSGTVAAASSTANNQPTAAASSASRAREHPYGTPLPERELIASAWKSEELPGFANFTAWADKYSAASANQKQEMLKDGVELATVRRKDLFELIQSDPRRALAAAVPMAVRDQLPSEITDLLEKRVGAYGDLYRIGVYNPENSQKPAFDYAKVDGNYYYASRYGTRASLFELKASSVIGVAVDDRLAVLDSPVAVPEIGQRLAGVPINKTCLVSGNSTATIGEGTVTERENAPIQVGNELIALCSAAHAEYVENALRALEAGGKSGSANGSLNTQAVADMLKDSAKQSPILGFGGTGGTAWPNMPSTNLTYGNKKAIVYRVQMQNWTAFPSNYTDSYLTNTIIGDQCSNCYSGMLTRTVSNQLFQFSWGKVVITQAVCTPIMLLPKTRDQYTNNYFGPVLDDARAASIAYGFNPNDYDFAVVVHSGLDAPNLNACAWGGGGAVWVNECWSVGVLVHEFGHVFGLPHANGWDITDNDVWSPSRTHVEYDDLTDPMGQGNGNYRNHYNSFFKYFIHWYPETLVLNVTNGGLYRVYQFDDFNAPLTNTFALLLRHDPVSSYWISLRGNTTSGNFGNAAYIQEVQNNKNDTHLLDFNSPDTQNNNGGLNVGQSYYDSIANITIQNVGIGGVSPMRYMDVNVVIGEIPALRAWYRFEGDAQDSSTNGNHGTLNGGASFVPGRVHASALGLNGVDSYAQVPCSIINDFSIALWVKTADTGGTGPWYNGKGLVDGTMGVGLSDFGVTLLGNKAAFGVGAPDTTISSTSAINDGKWHHVLASRNTTSGEMRLYVDGALQASAIGPIGPLPAPTALCIGALNTGSGFLNGAIDDVRFNNYLLSPGEVTALSTLPSAPNSAGTLYVDLHATTGTVVATIWSNQTSFGNFARVGVPTLVTNVNSTGVVGVVFNGISDAFQGPNSVADIDGGSDRSVEVWSCNTSLVSEETMVSWGHRGSTRRNFGFNCGTNTGFGAATFYGDDLGWGTPPTANEWHHLVLTYSNNVARVYVDGVLRNSKTLGGALNTFITEPINLGCQRDTANGNRSFFYGGYVNTVRVHGGVLSSQQIQANYLYGTWTPSVAPLTPGGLVATSRNGQVRLKWDIASGGAAGYNVKRSTVSGGPYTNIVAGLNATSFTDTNISNGATYYYVLSSVNYYGQSPDTSEVAAAGVVSPMPIVAGTLYVDLRATDASAGTATWLNQGTLDDFTEVGNPISVANVAGIPGVSFNGSTDAYAGPVTVPDIDGGGDRTVEIWAYNPALVSEETPVSWGRRGTTRRNLSFNFGNNGTWGAATMYGDDVGWVTPPTAGAWHHLVLTYVTNYVALYVDGTLRNAKILGGALDTFPGEIINIGCQREAAGTRSMFFSGYLNTVRIHGGVLTAQQVATNYAFGPWVPNSAPTLATIPDKSVVAGAMLSVANIATDANSSQQTLQFTLPTAPGGATLGTSSGVFNWRPSLAMANTTNPVTIMVSDNGVPSLSASRSFNVMVMAPMQPSISSAVVDVDGFHLTISGDAGPGYTVFASSNLVDWVAIWSNNSPPMPFLFVDPASTNYNQRFYKVGIGP